MREGLGEADQLFVAELYGVYTHQILKVVDRDSQGYKVLQDVVLDKKKTYDIFDLVII